MKIVQMLSIVVVVAVLGLVLPQEDSYAQGPGPVVPNEFTNQSGVSLASTFICSNNPGGVRAQTVFPAEDFAPGTIIGISNRLFPGSPGFPTVVIPDVTIKLSTTQVPVGQLSNTFADNVGSDETTVFQGALVIEGAPGCNTDPCPFPEPALFPTPFNYDPGQGNLLFEIEFPPCVVGIPDGVDLDSTPIVFPLFLETLFAEFGDDTGALFGTGFITKFAMNTQRPIPTLSEWGLIAMAGLLGIVGFVAIRRKYKIA